MSQTGGVTSVADVLNAMDKTLSRELADQSGEPQPGADDGHPQEDVHL